MMNSLEEVRLFYRKNHKEKAQAQERIKPNSTEIPQHKRGRLQTMNKQRDKERNHPTFLVAMVPGIQRCPGSSLQCVCATCRGVVYLQTALLSVCLMWDLCSWDVLLVPEWWGYLQIASKASRVRLMSRICAARVCMGCMERSSSSQRAISVYMP